METPAANPVHGSYAEHAAAETPAAKYLLAIKTECCLATALKDAEARARSAVAGEVDDNGDDARTRAACECAILAATRDSLRVHELRAAFWEFLPSLKTRMGAAEQPRWPDEAVSPTSLDEILANVPELDEWYPREVSAGGPQHGAARAGEPPRPTGSTSRSREAGHRAA